MSSHTAPPFRYWRYALWFAVLVLAANAGRMLYRRAVSAGVHAAALLDYTVVRTEKLFDSAGNSKGVNLYVEAARADGSKVRQMRTVNVQKRNIHFANGDEVRTNDLEGLKSTYPGIHAAGPETARDPQASCVTARELASGWSVAGQDSVGGNRAARVKYTPPGYELTLWYGLDSDCALLQQLYQDSNGVSEQYFTSLRIGEPDASLFEVSAALAEVPPSSLFACRNSAIPCTPLPDATVAQMDKPYYNSRKGR